MSRMCVCCSGMIVFKLERERPAYATHGETLFYVKERHLRSYDYTNQRDSPLISIRRIGSSGAFLLSACPVTEYRVSHCAGLIPLSQPSL